MKRLLPLVFLAACTPEPAETPADDTPRPPVVVYAAFAANDETTRLFERYTESTGVAIVNRHGDPEAIVDDLIRDDVTPPADVLMTTSAIGAWHAAEESGLRPIFSDELQQRVPEWARDADNLWFAKSADVAVLGFAADTPADDRPTSFAELADPAFAGKLCLSSSKLAINRAVIAMLIAEIGLRETELIVRGWVSNRAATFFGNEAEVATAIVGGACSVGILSRSAAATQDGLSVFQPEATIATITAIGVGRHAQNPDGAVHFAEWLSAAVAPIEVEGTPPRNASIAARNDNDARLLAERARFY